MTTSSSQSQQHHGAAEYYYSDDETRHSSASTKYTRSDFREQYCINERSLTALERSKSTNYLFSCISSYESSPCKRHGGGGSGGGGGGGNPFTSCYSRPRSRKGYYYDDDDEYEEEVVSRGGGGARYVRHGHPALRGPSGKMVVGSRSWHVSHDYDGVQSSDEGGFNSRFHAKKAQRYYDRRYVWNEELERYIETNQRPLHRYTSVPVQNMHTTLRSKHVSFDQDKTRLRYLNNSTSLERLIEHGHSIEPSHHHPPRPLTPTSSIHRTQSTQTDQFIVVGSGPPPYLSLSPRSGRQLRMISKGAQTNGGLTNGPVLAAPEVVHRQPKRLGAKRLEKTYSDGEILLERRKALKTSFQDVQLNGGTGIGKREPFLFKYKVDETFHERFIQNGQLRDSFESSRLQTSEDEEESSIEAGSSSAGSYMIIPELPPLPEPTDEPIIIENISPPEGFGDSMPTKRIKSFRSKSEEKCEIGMRRQMYRSWHEHLNEQQALEGSGSEGRGLGEGEGGSVGEGIGGSREWGADVEGIYSTPFSSAKWLPINQFQESLVWRTHEPLQIPFKNLMSSEQEFYKKFTSITHRLVHRKASAEIYRRIVENSLEITKRVQISRVSTPSGEFGFRIHGSRPVVVSAVEKATPADESGLLVGDVLISLNGVQVLESSHSHVVSIANVHCLEMELTSTSGYFQWGEVEEERIVWEGGVWRRCAGVELVYGAVIEAGGGGGQWVQRHLQLTNTSIQIYFSADRNTLIELLPLNRLQPATATGSLILDSNVIYPIQGGRGRFVIGFETIDSRNEFLLCVQGVGVQLGAGQDSAFISTVTYNCTLSPVYLLQSIPHRLQPPDTTYGHLYKFSKTTKQWSKYFTILSDCVLYFYPTRESEDGALGAIMLHGYRIQISNTTVGGRKWIFQCIPSIGGGGVKMRDYFFAVETETERKRWLAALEYSIDRWIQIDTQ